MCATMKSLIAGYRVSQKLLLLNKKTLPGWCGEGKRSRMMVTLTPLEYQGPVEGICTAFPTTT